MRRVGWFLCIWCVRAPFTAPPLSFEAAFDDRAFPVLDGGSAPTSLGDFAELTENLDDLALPQDTADHSLSDFQARFRAGEFVSAFSHVPRRAFPPVQSLAILTDELLATHGEHFGDRLRSRAHRWFDTGLDLSPEIRAVLTTGLRFSFPRGPPPVFFCQNAPSLQPAGNAAHCAFVDEQIDELLRLGVISYEGSLGDILASGVYHIHALLVVEQGPPEDPGSRLRLCLSCKSLNAHLGHWRLVMSTLESRRASFRRGQFFSYADIAKGYYHILVAPEHRHFLQFAWRGAVYQWICAPFGVSILPALFSDLVAVLLMRWQRDLGIAAEAFIDDIGVPSASRSESVAAGLRILTDLVFLGFTLGWVTRGISWRKCGIALQQATHLGMGLNFRSGAFELPDEKRRRILGILCTALTRGSVSPREAAEVIGCAWAARLAVGPGLHSLFNFTVGWIASLIRPAVKLIVLDAQERVPPALAAASRAFMSKALTAACDAQFAGLRILLRFVPRYDRFNPDPAWDVQAVPPSRVRLEFEHARQFFSAALVSFPFERLRGPALRGVVEYDASNVQGGAALTISAPRWPLRHWEQELLAPITFRVGIGLPAARGFHAFRPPQSDSSSESEPGVEINSSTHREVDVAESTIDWAARRLSNVARELLLDSQDEVLLVAKGDNKNACRLLRGRRSRHPELNAARDRIWENCKERRIVLQPEWIPRSLNKLADALSKIHFARSWQLAPPWFRAISAAVARRFGWHCRVDRFASAWDAQLPHWCSFMCQPGCYAVNSLDVPWTLPGLSSEEGSWVFPPGGLVFKVVAILVGRSALHGFPLAPGGPTISEACRATFRPYRSVLLVREFRQQPWFRMLQQRTGRGLCWTFPICAVFFLPYRDYRVPDPQFFIRDGDILTRTASPGVALAGSTRQARKMCFLLFIFDPDHPLAGSVPVSVSLPRLAF